MKKITTLVFAIFLISPLTFGQTTPPAKGKAAKEMPAPSKEDREKFAAAHEKMATCLRSDRSMQECHDEMRQTHEGMGMDMCAGMMGPGMKKGKGMKMRHQKMMEESQTTEEKK